VSVVIAKKNVVAQNNVKQPKNKIVRVMRDRRIAAFPVNFVWEYKKQFTNTKTLNDIMQKSFAHPNIMYKTDSINTTAIYAKD
jgi:hypothetical protein